MDAARITLTEPRRATLLALRDMTARHGRIPSLTELAKRRKLSVPGVKKHLDWLQQRRLVTKPPNMPRSCILTAAGHRALGAETETRLSMEKTCESA